MNMVLLPKFLFALALLLLFLFLWRSGVVVLQSRGILLLRMTPLYSGDDGARGQSQTSVGL